ncbi:hypothetical protein D5S18_20120 [Nocardia panacis]|uniref:Uncharacterized protein n=1 Tax=Nocardia panacis TaxID=2340916 RepID=A0A3A4KGY4_9NOCA|nr:hypothetical protein [Nocardia panacis]RJO73518.1 hypothetical protein D5S18_20120 [Nocardia panacis]
MSIDSDQAQARIFLDLLVTHARTLSRDIHNAERGSRIEHSHRLRAELHHVRTCIERLHHRFPELGPAVRR